MIIDFKEIPSGNSASGEQDTFELFARDFLESIGFEIISNPGRGADGGIDIKVRETRHGINEQTSIIDWLVSCKHYAKSGKSINTDIEKDILDRVKSNNCQGFIGIYSTIPSEGLNKKLKGISNEIPFQIFDSKKIENLLLGFKKREELFLRYFPNSYINWKELYYFKEPIKLFNFYLEKNSEIDINIFQNLFGTNEQILKNIRKAKDFRDFLLQSPVKVIQHNTLYNDINRIAKEHSSILKKMNHFESNQKITNDFLPKYLKEIYKINFKPKSIIFGMDGDKGLYLLYDNAMFANQPIMEEMYKTYKLLIDILD